LANKSQTTGGGRVTPAFQDAGIWVSFLCSIFLSSSLTCTFQQPQPQYQQPQPQDQASTSREAAAEGKI